MKTKEVKVVWITGASSGIGEALTYELNSKGYKLIISSRNLKDLQQVKNRCPNSNLISILPLDLKDLDNMAKKVTVAMLHYGPIDILINNAGISQRSFCYRNQPNGKIWVALPLWLLWGQARSSRFF